MAGGTCSGVLFTAVLCLCVARSAEGQAKICDLAGGYDIKTLRRCVKEKALNKLNVFDQFIISTSCQIAI